MYNDMTILIKPLFQEANIRTCYLAYDEITIQMFYTQRENKCLHCVHLLMSLCLLFVCVICTILLLVLSHLNTVSLMTGCLPPVPHSLSPHAVHHWPFFDGMVHSQKETVH